MTFVKYPRTRHIKGSRFQNGDHDLEAVPFSELKGKNLVVEEKFDGANAGISFSDKGELQLQSRGHYLRGGPREKQFNLLKIWASRWETELYESLGDRYVMFGEWMFAKHTMFYDNLPHYFLEFDLYDKKTEKFLSTQRRQEHYRDTLLSGVIVPVHLLRNSIFHQLSELKVLIQHSVFKTNAWKDNLISIAAKNGVTQDNVLSTTDLSNLAEGLYIKLEDENFVLDRYKFVRQSFTNSILEQGEHWSVRTMIPNQLSPEGHETMFSLNTSTILEDNKS